MDGVTKANVIIGILTACAPILIAMIGIIPTIINNRKKTEESIENMRKKTDESIELLKSDIKTCQTGLVNDIKKSNEALREELKADSAETNAKVDELSRQLMNHMRENEDDNAKMARARILDFYDDVCEGKRHSETHFEDVLDDIDFYTKYSEEHKDFKNSRGHAAMAYIREIYHKVKEHGGFLVHDTEE